MAATLARATVPHIPHTKYTNTTDYTNTGWGRIRNSFEKPAALPQTFSRLKGE
ncbi:MAG TPA: hypothetical protein PLS55_02045 [Thermogutta sp.]|nr:hypothetical protein [Thermogutta sp.]